MVSQKNLEKNGPDWRRMLIKQKKKELDEAQGKNALLVKK